MTLHYGQTRNDGVTPYSVHPIRVGGLLKFHYPDNIDLEIAGYLHDVVEDTIFGIDYIDFTYGENVARLVNDVTKYPDQDWKIPTHPDSVRLKAADTLDNVTDFNGNFAQFASGNRKIHQWWRIYDQCWQIIQGEPLERLLHARLVFLESQAIDAKGEEVYVDSGTGSGT